MRKIFLIITMLVVLTGCSNSNGEVSNLTIGIQSYINTLDPTEQYDSWGIVKFGVGETLTKFDEEGKVHPWLASEYSVSDDKLSWTFTIRDDITFSNGDQLTSELVKASLERSFELSNRATTFFSYETIETSENDLIITTTTPVANLPGLLADPLFLIINTNVDTTNISTEGPVATGPYVFSSFTPTQEIELIKNENYWDGEVGEDTVTIKFIEDQSTRQMALQSGEIDIAYNLKQENTSFFENDDYNIESIDSLRSTFAFMNQNGVLSDKALRQAIISSLDRSSYTDNLLSGGATAGKTPVPPSLDFGFDQLIDENSYGPERSKQLLADNGYVDTDGDGYVETADGQTLDLNFVLYTSRDELKIYAEAAQANLKEVGIKVTLNVVSYETMLEMRNSGDYDIMIWSMLVANTGDPEAYLRENWYSSSSTNTTGYANSEVDKLLDELTMEFDSEARKEMIVEIQQLIMDDAATIFFGYETTYVISSGDVEGLVLYPIDIYWLTKDVRISGEN